MNKPQANNLERVVSSAVAALVAMALTGCPSPPPAEEHADHAEFKVPTTLAEAHEQLEHMGADIKAAFDADKPGDAHDALHDIGSVIKALPALAEKAGVEAADEAKAVADDLMDGFSKLDGVLHGGDKVAWSDISEKVDAAMAKIEGWLPEGAGHDHEAEEHAAE